jgi:hypothetical protein
MITLHISQHPLKPIEREKKGKALTFFTLE